MFQVMGADTQNLTNKGLGINPRGIRKLCCSHPRAVNDVSQKLRVHFSIDCLRHLCFLVCVWRMSGLELCFQTNRGLEVLVSKLTCWVANLLKDTKVQSGDSALIQD